MIDKFVITEQEIFKASSMHIDHVISLNPGDKLIEFRYNIEQRQYHVTVDRLEDDPSIDERKKTGQR